MNIEIPDGKPYFINFSNDYYYRISRQRGLAVRGAGRPSWRSRRRRLKFYRWSNTFADSEQVLINYYSLFKEEMLNLLSGVIRCRLVFDLRRLRPERRATSRGALLPVRRPIGRLRPPGRRESAPLPDVPCRRASSASTRRSTRRSEYLRARALAREPRHELGQHARHLELPGQVSVKGSKDDVTTTRPGTQVAEYIAHPQTGTVVPRPRPEGHEQRASRSRHVIQELIDITGQPVNVPATPCPTSTASDDH